MQPIRFYQIPFSHFCDKVRWALDFYSLDYESIDFSSKVSRGLERAPKDLQRLVPIIEDVNVQPTFISDSTPILVHLERHYARTTSLFGDGTAHEQEQIVKYCLYLDSHLGLYVRRLAYLYIINENPSLLSVLVDGDYRRTSFNDWQSYVKGLFGSSIILGRFAIHRTYEDNIWNKTIETLDRIENDLGGNKYLFADRFTAADLTLTSLMGPLSIVPDLAQLYPSIFDYCRRIRDTHDPKRWQPSLIEQTLVQRRQATTSSIGSVTRALFYRLFACLLYPMQFAFAADTDESLRRQYPSSDITAKANNDNRVLQLRSLRRSTGFFIKYMWHCLFSIPQQVALVNRQVQKTKLDKKRTGSPA
jgi:glutathione S-transferase